jgi:hypothetical protein
MFEGVRIDPDWINTDTHGSCPAIGVLIEIAANFTAYGFHKVATILLGVKAQEIVNEHVLKEFSSPRVGGQDIHRWKRCVKKEPNIFCPPQGTELSSERNQMIVMDPNEIAFTQKRDKTGGKVLIDLLIGPVFIRT